MIHGTWIFLGPSIVGGEIISMNIAQFYRTFHRPLFVVVFKGIRMYSVEFATKKCLMVTKGRMMHRYSSSVSSTETRILQISGRRIFCDKRFFVRPTNLNCCFLSGRAPTKRTIWMVRSVYGVNCQDHALSIPPPSSRPLPRNNAAVGVTKNCWMSDYTNNKMHQSTQQQQQQQIDANKQPDVIQMAHTLLDLKTYPIGTFTSNEYSKVKMILYHYLNGEKPSTKEAINQPIDIIVRLAQEVAYINSTFNDSANASNNIRQELHEGTSSTEIPKNTLAATSNPFTYEWILNANYYNPILTTWKNYSLNVQDRIPGIYSGLDVLQKLQYMSKILPPTIFKVNIITITMVLQVITKQVRRDEAPMICEKVLQMMSQRLQQQKEIANAAQYTSSVRLQRELKLYETNMYSYNLLIKAWAESRLDNAYSKIESIIQEINDNPDLELGLVTYKILLRFYSRMGDVENVNHTLQQMHLKKLPIDVDCLTQALNCCCRAGQLDNAHTILNMIIHQHPHNAERTKAVQESIHYLVAAYRNRLDKAFAEQIQKAGDDDSIQVSHDDDMSSSMNNVDHGHSSSDDNLAATKDEAVPRPAVAQVVQNTIQRLQDLTNIVKTNQILNHHSLGTTKRIDLYHINPRMISPYSCCQTTFS
jgi:pentatricopeptide repeat protein